MSRKKNAPTFSSFQANGTLPATGPKPDAREEKIDAVKKFSASTTVKNPYQSLSATALSRVISKNLPGDMEELVQYYNHIDAIHATSFVEKCRVLAHAHDLFRNEDTRAEFRKEEGGWLEFLEKIGMSQSQVSRFVSFWNVFGEELLTQAIAEDLTSSKLAELLSWPEDPRAAMLDGRTYPIGDGEKTVYEMTREELREVKRMLNQRKDERVIDQPSPHRTAKIQIDFGDADDPLLKNLQNRAKEEGTRPEDIIRLALEQYLRRD